MKRILLFICLILSAVRFGQAQSLTVEYNIGHGSYQMSEMKDRLKDLALPVVNALTTDKFPGYVTQDTRVGIEWKRNHAGLLFNFMNTAGKKGVADYSGHCNYELRNKGYKLGAFYRFRLTREKLGIITFEPYVQLSSGVVLSRGKELYSLFIVSAPESSNRSENKYSGTNIFLEPTFGIKFGLCRTIALNLSVGYEWDAVKEDCQLGNPKSPLPVEVDWSGYRAQAGLVFYLNLKK